MAVINTLEFSKYLEGKLNASNLEITSQWRNLEGWSMVTYSLGLSYDKDGERVERDIIVRREPVSGLLEPYDISIEYRVVTAIGKTDVLVPKTYWYEPDPEVLGKPFYVMEKVEGAVHSWKTTFDPNFQLIPDDKERESLAGDFVQNIASLHKADWRALGLDFLGDPGPGKGSSQSQVDYWEDVIERAGFRENPLVAYATNWLRGNLPDNDKVTIVHGDYRTGNYIARDGRIAAVLDWEMVHLGDPVDDIAYIIGTVWRSPRPRALISHLLSKDEFFERYEGASGVKIDAEKLKFYTILVNYKSIGISATAANAFRTKHNPDLKPGVFGETTSLHLFNLIRALNKYLKR